MKWQSDCGILFITTNNINELNIIQRSSMRFVNAFTKECNCVVFDTIAKEYRLCILHVYEKGDFKYKLISNAAHRYRVCMNDKKLFTLWCQQKLEYGI